MTLPDRNEENTDLDEHGSLDPPPHPWCWESSNGAHWWRAGTCRWCPASEKDATT